MYNTPFISIYIIHLKMIVPASIYISEGNSPHILYYIYTHHSKYEYDYTIQVNEFEL